MWQPFLFEPHRHIEQEEEKPLTTPKQDPRDMLLGKPISVYFDCMKKKQLVAAIERLPEEFSAEELIEQILLLEKIETSQKAVKQGDVFPHDDLPKHLAEWFLK